MTAKRKNKKKKSPAKPRKSAAKKRAQRLDRLLDRELEETFPASDPVELTEPGRRVRRRKTRA